MFVNVAVGNDIRLIEWCKSIHVRAQHRQQDMGVIFTLLFWLGAQLFSMINPKAHERFQALSNELGLDTGGLGGSGLAYTSNVQLTCLSQVLLSQQLKAFLRLGNE